MTRATTLGAVAVVALLALAAPSGAALEVRVSITPKRPSAFEQTAITLRTYAPLLRTDGSCCRLEPHAPRSFPFRVEAVSPVGKTSRVHVRLARGNEWRGIVRFSRPGRWLIRLPQFGKTISVRVRPPLPTPAPAGFGPLGRSGCSPPSPADASAQAFRDVFGTAVGDEELWARPFLPAGASWVRQDAAVFDGLVGKEIKIVFAMTSVRPPFHALDADGTSLGPVWRRGHTGATWVGIAGHQWGAGFVFPRPGCWRIRVGPLGDVFLLVRS